MRITVSMLEEKEACEDQGALFKSFLSGRSFCLLTARNLMLAQKTGLDVPWFIKTFAQDLGEFREFFLGVPEWAYHFALFVDRAPRARDDTRKAVCGSPKWAYMYAKYVDCGPHDETRAAACSAPYWAHMYACYVDKCPRDDTRAAACRSPYEAYCYARDVDCGPHDDTRAACSEDPYEACLYTMLLGEASPS